MFKNIRTLWAKFQNGETQKADDVQLIDVQSIENNEP